MIGILSVVTLISFMTTWANGEIMDSVTGYNTTRNQVITCFSDDGGRNPDKCIYVLKAKLDSVYQLQLNYSLEYRLLYAHRNVNETLAIRVESPDFQSSSPILFVVRQKKSVTSWELPYVLESSGTKQRYYVFRRTLCPDPMETLDSTGDFINIDVSTSSREQVTFRIAVWIEDQFHVELNQQRRVQLTASENQIFKFTFPPGISQVALKSTSPDNVCLTISIQNALCPTFDTIYNVEYEGLRQTMTGRSTVIITKHQFPEGFHITYIVNVDDSMCLTEMHPTTTSERVKNLTFEIKKTVSMFEFEVEIFIFTLSVYVGFILVVAATCIVLETSRRKARRMKARESSSIGFFRSHSTQSSFKTDCSPTSTIVMDDLYKEQSASLMKAITLQTSSSSPDHFGDHNSALPESPSKENGKRLWRVADMTKQHPQFYNKTSRRYVSELCIIAVFYSIPVGQLVYNYKNMMITTGDQDMCYYNFACAYPYQLIVDFSDFNHFFSNIGYIILGIIFLLITKRKENNYHTDIQNNPSIQEHGIAPHYGLFYAMGGALIVEGVLSACYHICPTRANFQFDTSFMYVIAALCTLKLYHARHADVNAKSYTAYIVLAFIVLLGAGIPAKSEYSYKIAFTIFHLIACIALSVDVYYMGQCEWRCDYKKFAQHVTTCWKSRPLYTERLTLVIVGSLCNVAFIIFELIVNSIDFNTHLLGVFLINLFVYSVFYIIMKSRKNECIARLIYPILHLIASIVFWVTGIYFYLHKAAKWEDTPAESRMRNEECFAGKVYDSHDLWHFLSSAALFFFFMFLLTLDDDIENKPRKDIPVF